MKRSIVCFAVAVVAALTLGTGCETTSAGRSGSKATASANIEVFREGAVPARAYRQIGVLKDDGKEVEQDEIEAKMIKQATKMGANAIISNKPKPSGSEVEFWSWGSAKYTYLYVGTVVVYE